MKDFYEALSQALHAGEDMLLVRLIASSGSAPRGAGARMLVYPDGHTLGSIGGGAVEYAAVQAAQQALLEKRSWIQGYSLEAGQAADLGMVCGGKVTVCFEYITARDPDTLALFEQAAQLQSGGENAWLISEIRHGAVRDRGLYTAKDGLRFSRSLTREQALPLCAAGAVLRDGDPMYYAEPIARAGTVYIFGGGHVCQELVPLISHIGFRAAVFEDRAAFLRPELFPGAQRVIEGEFSDIQAKLRIRPEDYAVIMTRGHQADYEVLRQALRTPATYIGMIGSRHKIAHTFGRLYEEGFTQKDTDRVHTPIGLAIGAQTPAEIAVSIAAQLVAHRAGKE